MMLLASAPFTAMAQGQAGIKAENLDKSVRPADDFFTFARVDGRSLTRFLERSHALARSTSCKRTTTSVSTRSSLTCSRNRVRKGRQRES